MTYEKIFETVKKNFEKAKTANLKQDFAFQFNITGEGEGIFYVAFKEGKLLIEPYDYKDRDVIFTADGKTLTDISAGKLEPIDAIKDGRLTVDGSDLSKQLMNLIPASKAEPKKAAPAKKEAAKPAAKKTAPAKKEAAKPAAKPAPAKPAAAAPAAKPTAAPAVKPAATAPAVKPAAAPAAKPAATASAVKPAAAPAAASKPAATAVKADTKSDKK